MKKRTPSRSRSKCKATTVDIVSPDQAGRRISRRWQKHYKRLLELRDHVMRQRADLARDALEEHPTFSTHMADAGTDTYDRDFALGMLSSEQDAVYEIEQALDRIRNGAYGVCELTGKGIEADRLEAIPWTRFCASAERQLEEQGSTPATSCRPPSTSRTGATGLN